MWSTKKRIQKNKRRFLRFNIVFTYVMCKCAFKLVSWTIYIWYNLNLSRCIVYFAYAKKVVELQPNHWNTRFSSLLFAENYFPCHIYSSLNDAPFFGVFFILNERMNECVKSCVHYTYDNNWNCQVFGCIRKPLLSLFFIDDNHEWNSRL